MTLPLDQLRAHLLAHAVDLFVVRGTDRFLDEYVPTAESSRVWVTGFTGSTGDALAGASEATVFIDGRYTLQAEGELAGTPWRAVTLPLGQPIERGVAEAIVEAARVAGRPLRVGYEPDRFPVDLFERFRSWIAAADVALVPFHPSLVERARGAVEESRGVVRAVDDRATGRPVSEKVARVARLLHETGAHAMLVQRLDEIAYLTNLRGDELPYQATFRGIALCTARDVVLRVDRAEVPADVRAARPDVRFEDAGGFEAALGALGEGARVLYDPAGTTLALVHEMERLGLRPTSRPSPLTAMKASKTPEELASMRRSFARADRVVWAAQRWLIEAVSSGVTVTEADFAAYVEARFREAGATGLSFKVIAAAGENAAVVHHPPSSERVIRRGEMVLLDTGAYFEEGYATDLTRTFFVGLDGDTPTPEMRRWYTATLKAAIAGMNAVFPAGATGAQLDGIVRAPLWAAGFEYQHGTGHGVGINVHEFPPRVASVSLSPVESGQVFSIEPGVYVQGHGGVRIENLCTAEPHPSLSGFLRVRPMTFSPLDARLIDASQLTDAERAFLDEFASRFEP